MLTLTHALDQRSREFLRPWQAICVASHGARVANKYLFMGSRHFHRPIITSQEQRRCVGKVWVLSEVDVLFWVSLGVLGAGLVASGEIL